MARSPASVGHPKPTSPCRKRALRASADASGVAAIGFLEDLEGAVSVERVLGQRVLVPFAAVGGEEIPAIDVDRGGKLGGRISDGVDDVLAKRLGVLDGD